MDKKINFTKFNRFQPARPIEDRFWEKVDKKSDNECWAWLASISRDGYGCFGSDLAHRVSWKINRGEIPPNMYVCHKCDNPQCVNPSHLFLGTQFDNMQDMVRKGRISNKAGEANPKSKLTEADVWDIHHLKEMGVSIKSLAREFEVSTTCISYVLSGKSWNYIYREIYG